jgi:hypothetical protein
VRTDYLYDLIHAKKNLYAILLTAPVDELTDNEIELGYRLSLDKDIQAILDTSMVKCEKI